MSGDRLSLFYDDVAKSVEAGLPFHETFWGGNVFKGRFRERAAHPGEDNLRLLVDEPKELPKQDRELIRAGLVSGHLPFVLEALSTLHARKARIRRRVVLALIYPSVVYHLGAIVVPFSTLMVGSKISSDPQPFPMGTYIATVLALLAVFYGFMILFKYFNFGPSLKSKNFHRFVPFFKGAAANEEIGQIALMLGVQQYAGTGIESSWKSAKNSVCIPSLISLCDTAIETVRGQRPASMAFPAFDSDRLSRFFQSYRTGERTGKLAENMIGMSKNYFENAEADYTKFGFFAGGLITVIVVIAVVAGIISFYLQYINSLLNL